MKRSLLMKSGFSLFIVVLCVSINFGPKSFGIHPVLFSLSIGILISIVFWKFSDEIPNGKPRPEDELKRGVMYYIIATVGTANTRTIFAQLEDSIWDYGTYWDFSRRRTEVVEELKAGDRFVYVDDLRQTERCWREEDNVTVILSVKGKERLITALAEETLQLTRRV